MKQLLLRVEDSLHAQLAARARREHRSVNALANEILAVAARVTADSPRDQVKARAAALGMLAPPLTSAAASTAAEVQRDQVIARTRGLGRVLDDILGQERDRA